MHCMQGGARAHARGCHGAMLVLCSGCLGTIGVRRGTGWWARQHAKMLWAQTSKERDVASRGGCATGCLFGLVSGRSRPHRTCAGGISSEHNASEHGSVF
eukprot:scaffold116144_cov36-Phaeocystis_antarctica.AAC.4